MIINGTDRHGKTWRIQPKRGEASITAHDDGTFSVFGYKWIGTKQAFSKSGLGFIFISYELEPLDPV